MSSVPFPGDVAGADVVPPPAGVFSSLPPDDVPGEEEAGAVVLLAGPAVLLAAALDEAEELVDEFAVAVELEHWGEAAGDADLVDAPELLGGSVAVVVVPVGLALPVVLLLTLGLGLPVLVVEVGSGEGLGLVDELDELGELGGLVVDVVAFAAALVVAPAAAAWVVVHGTAGVADAEPLDVPADVAPVPEDRPVEPLLSWLPPPVGELLLLVPTMDAVNWPTAERSGGTAAMMTPTMNTAMPTASAGRSIASRQSLGRCDPRCAGPGPRRARLGAAWSPRNACQRPARAARSPETARRARAIRDSSAVA